MAKSPEINRTAWTVEEYLASEGYTVNELELALVKLYAQADFIEWEGRLPGEQYSGEEVLHIDQGIAKMVAGQHHRDNRHLLRELMKKLTEEREGPADMSRGRKGVCTALTRAREPYAAGTQR